MSRARVVDSFKMPVKIKAYERDLVGFIDQFVKVGETGRPFQLYPFQRELLSQAFAFDADGRLPWDTFVYSTVKKSGKSAIEAIVTDWWALTQEAPNEIFVLANDQEQSKSRVFAAAAKILKKNPGLRDCARIEASKITFANDTTITALASDYAGAAGSNHGLTAWDELWAYVTEGSRCLWDEMTPVPTRTNSIRFIATYAGFETESDTLRSIYLQGVGPEEHPDGKGVKIHPDLPLYFNAEARLLVYWDHVGRLPWQTDAYYAAQKRTLRASAYQRLHLNEWTTGESSFITAEVWDAVTDANHRPILPSATSKPTIFVGVDASTKHDTSAVVAVRWNGSTVELVKHQIWKPTATEPLDMDATVEPYLKQFRKDYTVKEIRFDPYQLHSVAGRLTTQGLPMVEYSQTTQHLTAMAEALLGLLNGRNLRVYNDDELRKQALDTIAGESPRGMKIAKRTAGRKIDAIVALAMACTAAVEHGPVTTGFSVTAITKIYTPRISGERTDLSAVHPHDRPGERETNAADDRIGKTKAAAWREALKSDGGYQVTATMQAREDEARGGRAHCRCNIWEGDREAIYYGCIWNAYSGAEHKRRKEARDYGDAVLRGWKP
jgi:phage terminase large subunit-like protein